MTEPHITFILGGARSGKSRKAQAMAEETGAQRVFIATAQAFDDEMRHRIARHRDDRGNGWRTVECPLDLPEAIVRESLPGRIILVDCLTLWASNLLLAEADTDAATAQLIEALCASASPVILVSNEVGLGIVPDNALARRFRDVVGHLHQRVAAIASDVRFMAAGLELRLK